MASRQPVKSKKTVVTKKQAAKKPAAKPVSAVAGTPAKSQGKAEPVDKKPAGTKTKKVPAINPKYVCFKLEIKPSKIHRWGVYAAEDIPVRRKVMEYTGERINRKETKRRSEEQGRMIYLFTLDSYWTLDGAVGGSGAEYINHCCDPNIVTEIRQGHILYFTRRPIRKGEELTVDYHFGKDIEKVICKCGAATCRGTINLK